MIRVDEEWGTTSQQQNDEWSEHEQQQRVRDEGN